MSLRELHVGLGARAYPIRIGPGLLSDPRLAERSGRQAFVLTSAAVAGRYLPRLLGTLSDAEVGSLVVADGEGSKSLAQAEAVFTALSAMRASRDCTLYALGGGVIGDLGGFCASLWMRGIDYVQLPTTLLAMVDSSVGGKTAVNLPAGKNLVGSFWQPRAVYADLDVLASLPAREYRAGLAEVVKYGAILDADFLTWLEEHAADLDAAVPEKLADAIARCCAIKAAVVARDEREQGERALLNFGHSFGHAIELLAGYGGVLHGEAVAIGMVLAARCSEQHGHCSPGVASRLHALLSRLQLPTELPAGLDPEAMLSAMALDKKNRSGSLRLILLRDLGQAFQTPVEASALRPLLETAAAHG